MRYRHLLFERNILNLNDITSFVERMAARAQSPAVQQWVRSMVPPYLKKTYPRLEPVSAHELPRYWPPGREPSWAVQAAEQADLFKVVLDGELQQQVSEVIDYLESEAGHNLGRLPFEAALKRSQQWHHDLAQQTTEPTADQAGAEVFKSYADGSKWWLLPTPACLDAEGEVMGNCVGRGSYDKRVMNKEIRIFSLRDVKNDSHVTAAMTTTTPIEVGEIKGKQNKVPIPKYRPYVIDLLNTLHAVTSRYDYDLKHMGIFHGAKGFGSISEVAAHGKVLPSGNRLMQMDAEPTETDYYIVSQAEQPLCTLPVIGGTVDDIQLPDHQADVDQDTKALRDDLIVVINSFVEQGLKLDHMVRYHLLRLFGLHVDDDNKLVPVHSMSDMQLVSRNLLYRVYVGTADGVVVDETDHPVVYFSISKATTHDWRTTGQVVTHRGWEAAIPLLLTGLRRAKVLTDKQFMAQLRRAGWFNIGGKWLQGKKIVADAKPVLTTDSGAVWYQADLDNMLWLWKDNQIKAGLHVATVTDDDDGDPDTLTVDWIDEAFVKFADVIANDVADIFQESIATIKPDKHERYYWNPFLIGYDVCSDGEYSFQAINWDTPVTVQTDYINTKYEVIKEVETDRTLGSVGSDLNFDEDREWNELALDVVIHRGSYEEQDDQNDEQSNPVEEYYDDPDEYRRSHKMKPKSKLPALIRITTTVRAKRR